ncbi:ABC transporter ATP-binding protein [Nocardioides lentus]|uniref:ABC transporter ATP-binding protein n=1 Tax=Nocardioides lentus TaxID=338077 RepID=UPI0031D81CCF
MRTPETWRVVAPSARPHRRRLLLAGALVVAETGVVLLRPWPLALAVDHALTGAPGDATVAGPTAVLVAAALAGLVLTVLLGVLRMGSDRLAEGTAERVGDDLRRSVFERAMTRSLRWHDTARGGELLSRVTTDVGRVVDGLVALTTTVVPELLLLLGVLVLIATLQLELAAVGLGVVPVLVWLTLDQRRRVRAAETASRAAAGRLATTTQDLVRHVRTVQAFGRIDLARDAFGSVSGSQADADVEAIRTASRWSPLAEGVLAVGTAAVLVVGGSHVLRGDLSVGALLVVIAYLRDLYGPVRSLTRLAGLLARADVSAHRLGDVLSCDDSLPEPVPGPVAPPVRQGISLRGVGFAYRPGADVLRDLDLTVGAGETVCLLGPSGAGKSTVLHLLLRLYDVDRGGILIDGVDVRHCSLASVRSRFAFLPQDPWLLDDTVAANVALGRPGAGRDEIEAACRRARVDEFVDTLPLGLDSRVGEDAVRLSGGQGRRVALARAVVSQAPALLLDEPTASLDDRAAREVVAALAAATRGRAALVVTHDHRVADVADRVVSLRPVRSRAPVPRPAPSRRDREEVAS